MPKKADWRKLSTAAAEDAIDTENIERDLAASDLASQLFEVDTEGSAKKMNRERRGQVSFAKKLIALPESQEKKAEKYSRKMKASNPKRSAAEAEMDLWGKPGPAKTWCGKLSKDTEVRVSYKMTPSKRPDSMAYKPSVAPAVKPAHSGQSINPKQENYEELVGYAAALELRKIEEEAEKMARWTKPMTCELEDRFGKEAVEAMTEEEKIKAFLGEEVEDKPVELPVKKITERKTTTQRNKEARQKILKDIEVTSQQTKKFEKQINNVGTLLKEIEKFDKKKEKLEKFKQHQKEWKENMERKGVLVGTAKFGKYKFTEPEMEAAQPREDGRDDGVKTSVRRAQVLMGSAIRDRMNSIYRRKLLPANPMGTMENLHKAKNRRARKELERTYLNPKMREAVREGKIKHMSVDKKMPVPLPKEEEVAPVAAPVDVEAPSMIQQYEQIAQEKDITARIEAATAAAN